MSISPLPASWPPLQHVLAALPVPALALRWLAPPGRVDAMLLAGALIALSSAFYTWVWLHPSAFARLCGGSEPCLRMSLLSNALKLAQFAACIASTDWARAAALPVGVLLCAAALAVLGQHLNALVYLRLGTAGVYYGSRFGRSLPWVSAYPFSVVPHPQYVGSSLSVAAAAVLVPWPIAAWWVANYVYLALLESDEPQAARKIAVAAAAYSAAPLRTAGAAAPPPRASRRSRAAAAAATASGAMAAPPASPRARSTRLAPRSG